MDNPLPTPDHDLLITLHTKMDGLTGRVDEMAEGFRDRLIRVETRLDQMDIYHASIPLKDYDSNSKWLTRFRSNLGLLMTMVGLLLTIAGGLVSRAIAKYFGF